MAAQCRRCGTAIRGRRLCSSCSLDERKGNIAGGDGDERSEHVYQCIVCGMEYVSDGFPHCPECGEKRRRYAGESDEYDGDLPRVDPGEQGGVEA